MSVRNRMSHAPLTGPRWRQCSFDEPELAPGEITFHGSLRDCIENRAELRPIRNEKNVSFQASASPVRKASIGKESVGKEGMRAIEHAWSWIRATYASIAVQRSRVAERASQRNRVSISPRTASTLRPGMLKQAVSWLNAKYSISATKRLRVAEVVSLGEKRFVALVKVEDREF